MVLHCRRHVWIGTMGTSGVKLSISGVRWNTSCWSYSIFHAEILHEVFASSISISYSVKWLCVCILSNCISKTNSWNGIDIKELEIISISITMEHVT